MRIFLCLCMLLLLLGAFGCGTDSPSSTAGQPTTDDQVPDNDITDAIFTSRNPGCGDYADMYVSDVMDVQSGAAFTGERYIRKSWMG